jgi:hypothetical protein
VIAIASSRRTGARRWAERTAALAVACAGLLVACGAPARSALAAPTPGLPLPPPPAPRAEPDGWSAIDRAERFRSSGDPERARPLLRRGVESEDPAIAAASRLLLGVINLRERGITPNLIDGIEAYRASGGFAEEDPDARFPLDALLPSLSAEEAERTPAARVDSLIALCARVEAPRAGAAAFQLDLGHACLALERPREASAAFALAAALRDARERSTAGDPIAAYPAREAIARALEESKRARARGLDGTAGPPAQDPAAW